MPKTRNGFDVQEPGSPNLDKFAYGGSTFVVWKPALSIVKHFANFLDSLEPAKETGWDGAYAHRKVRGSTTVWSEHAAGTAFDWNASQHPQGASRTAGWDAVQVRMIRWYLDETIRGKLWRWGADFTTTPDPMHFEIRSRTTWDAYVKTLQAE